MLRAALPCCEARGRLRAPATAREDDARALHQVLDAVEDGLDGHGWPSLTVGKAGQGFNLAQRRALAFGFAYIEAAGKGRSATRTPFARSARPTPAGASR